MVYLHLNSTYIFSIEPEIVSSLLGVRIILFIILP